jgi:hypothetical protein
LKALKRWFLAVYYAVRYGHLEYAPRGYIVFTNGNEIKLAVATRDGWCHVNIPNSMKLGLTSDGVEDPQDSKRLRSE